MQSIEPIETGERVIERAVRSARALSLSALLIEPSSNTWVQFARYTVVGGVAFVGDFFTSLH